VRTLLYSAFLLAAITAVLRPTTMCAQQSAGKVSGVVTDSADAVLPGARVELHLKGEVAASTASDGQGQFAISNLAPGTYAVVVSYVGFSSFETSATVTAGQTARVTAVLKVSSESESVIVTAERAHGEAEAVNEEKIADNILNVLPSPVITSLPNANVADAVGRLPGVTLERDEGEGKYVQIRGTEPRLANLTIDGVEVPSPEGGVRQVKLDVIPSDLIDSVQINKTLQANQNGDAIGGSVNLVTKKAGDRPTLSLFGLGGFTPIANTRPVYEFGGTGGARFGSQKRFGLMVSGSYDYNGRGIDDIEPVPGLIQQPSSSTLTPDISSAAIRQYLYERKRYGFGGSLDYRLSETSNLYIHTLFSDFKDYGNRYEYVINTNDVAPAFGVSPIPGANVPNFTTERRDPDFQVANKLAVRSRPLSHVEPHRGRRVPYPLWIHGSHQQLPVQSIGYKRPLPAAVFPGVFLRSLQSCQLAAAANPGLGSRANRPAQPRGHGFICKELSHRFPPQYLRDWLLSAHRSQIR
jgi:hypothetical protein